MDFSLPNLKQDFTQTYKPNQTFSMLIQILIATLPKICTRRIKVNCNFTYLEKSMTIWQ
ncbi:hypothetical protein [uncultured Methanobrevibacter sp.]|uniref:hypothetical protein n=1 Tax=uncultured Methanobrevibacter sp. TaxID=253161 RepID=UPI0025CC70EE|nr:hypothetical protein [uncultured Methanobrevibacter sp.]